MPRERKERCCNCDRELEPGAIVHLVFEEQGIHPRPFYCTLECVVIVRRAFNGQEQYEMEIGS